jgi:hypothetical protein
MKRRLYRSIDAPWNEDDPRYKEDPLLERWQIPTTDECGWIPIRPPKPPGWRPTCSQCGFVWAWGDMRMGQKCHCQRKADRIWWGKVALVISMLGLLIASYLIYT